MINLLAIPEEATSTQEDQQSQPETMAGTGTTTATTGTTTTTAGKLGFAITNVTSITGYDIQRVVMPVYTGGFSNEKFWDNFYSLHPMPTDQEMIKLVLDATRCHWGPNPRNWPGMDITVTFADNTSFVVSLQAGKTSLKVFKRGAGAIFSWTGTCLATAGVFEEVFRQSNQIDTSSINGNWQGANQFMTTVMNFTEVHYNNCKQSLSTWLTTIGQKPRDAAIQAKIDKAAKATIDNRTASNCAWKISNIARHLNGDAIVEADHVTFTEAQAAVVP